jgi:hypothetical protein
MLQLGVLISIINFFFLECFTSQKKKASGLLSPGALGFYFINL